MLTRHIQIFLDVAHEFTCWIYLREPNRFAEPWINHVECIPKDLNCSAKTADNPAYPFRGLAVDPTITGRIAFDGPDSYEQAMITFNSWVKKNTDPNAFRAINCGKMAGVIMHKGFMLHADYDIMLIDRASKHDGKIVSRFGELRTIEDPKTGKLIGQDSDFAKDIINILNLRLAPRYPNHPLIPHGTEFGFNGVGARGVESIYRFGPNGEFILGPSAMPGEFESEAGLYKRQKGH